MPVEIVALVLAAACMHAAWNALLKSSRDISLDTALIACAAALIAGCLLPFVPLPAPASWPYLAISCLVQLAYYRLLALAYRHGDLSFAYPLMRGMAPPLVALVGMFVLSDQVSPWLWAGIASISLGVLTIGGTRALIARAPPRATVFALANAAVIAAYTLIDGIGARLAGNALSYGLWLFFLIGLPIAPLVVWRRGHVLGAHLQQHALRGLLSGALSVTVYLAVLWAMTLAPIAAVAALRETAVIFAALIGTLWLKEPFGRNRVAGACLVALGVGLLRA